ncbi:MAG TPA: DbpA RNA binding domain-containing protein [Gemmatimonadales bacterium]|nr:DbpA RNA binding domain-containing protein [Gemmatimonadales bacterium]
MTQTDAQAALERGRPVVLVCPPAPERAGAAWDLIGPRALIVCADDSSAAEWAAAAPAGTRVHAVTGLARTTRLLRETSVPTLAGSAKDLAALVQRSALKPEAFPAVLVAWPEDLPAGDDAAALDTLLGEAREARRVVLSWSPGRLDDFLERHARRPLVVGTLPVDESGAPLGPVCRARYAVVPPARRAAAVRDALDALKVTLPLVWSGGAITAPSPRPDAVLCTALPDREQLAALARLGEPVIFASAAQLPYLRSVATLTPLTLPSAADRAQDRAEALRERVAAAITAGGVDAELALLAPLFERFDPAEVAAALLALLGEGGRGKKEEAARPLPADAGRVKVFVNVGKKDRASAKDLVGALIREAGLAKGDIGRIEVKESFSLIEVGAAAAPQAVRKLTGATIRGRRVTPRLDRDA